jgi:hypothetical protein
LFNIKFKKENPMNLLRPFRLLAAAVFVALVSHLARADDNAPPLPAAAPPAPAATITTRDGLLVVSTDKPEPGQPAPYGQPAAFGAPQIRNVVLYMNTKKVKATYLGVYIAPSDATLQSQLGLPDGVGLVVSGLDDSGPAKQAGLREHDVIYKLGDQIAVNPAQFEVLVRLHKPGEAIELTVYRQAQPIKITATLVEKELPPLPLSADAFTPPLPMSVRTFTISPNNQFNPNVPLNVESPASSPGLKQP